MIIIIIVIAVISIRVAVLSIHNISIIGATVIIYAIVTITIVMRFR